MDPAEDDDLIQRAKAGDQQALGELLRGQNRLLSHMAEQEISPQLKTRLGTSDIVQLTCLSAVRNFEQFQGHDAESLAAWLLAMQRRNLRDAARRHLKAEKRAVSKQKPLLQDQVPATSQATASQQLQQGEQAHQLEQHLHQLPDDQALALRLRYLQELSLREISEQMNRSDVAVASLLKRGLKTLRDRLPQE